MELASHGRTVSYEDLKLMGLDKAVDEYARIARHSRSNSRTRHLVGREGVNVAPGLHGNADESESEGRPSTFRPPFQRMCVCVRGACACLVLPPIPSVLFQRELWEICAALAVPVVVVWCISRCCPGRCLATCVALLSIGKLSSWLRSDTSNARGEDVAAVESSFRRFKDLLSDDMSDLVMTERVTDIDGGQIEALHHAGDRVRFQQERAVLAHVERLVVRYGYGSGSVKVNSLVNAYAWISRLAAEMHLDRGHRRVSSLDDADVSIQEIAARLGVPR